MKTEKLTKKNRVSVAMIPLALLMPLTVFSAEATKVPTAIDETQTAIEQPGSKGHQTETNTQKQIVKEAADAFKATETALEALENNHPKQALAALEVVSGNLNLLLARDPSLGLIPIDFEAQIFEGVRDLKTIKKLEEELDDLIDDKRYQAARPIVDSLIDEIRITTVYLPLATYPATIERIAPLIDAGNIDEAKQLLIGALNTFISEQEVTPLAIIRADKKLTEAFQIEHKADLSKQETKDKIEKLVKDAEQHIKIAQTLGYGTKDDYENLYSSINALKKVIGTDGFKGEWSKIKKSMSVFKNKIVHPRG